MKIIYKLTLLSALTPMILGVAPVFGATTVISDNFNVTGSSSGFGLNAGFNSGINPPTTRLTGSAAANLRYINVFNKNDSAYTITSNKGNVSQGSQSGRFTLSANGTSAFDFGSTLGVSSATPANPTIYDVAISMNNKGTTGRMSFALGTEESTAGNWNFGIQIYKSGSAYNIYKRIKTEASGLASEINSVITTAGTAGSEISFLIRVTDAGAESGANYHSRVQVSMNGGSTWFYDTDSDAALVNGWRFENGSRYFSFDQAPNDGADTYDGFSVTWNSGTRTWSGAGANGNWSTVANWSGAAPVSGSGIFFSGTTRQNNTNDISGLSLPFLTLNSGGFTLNGNAITLTGALTNASGNNTLNSALTLGAAAQFQSVSGTLTINGAISGSGKNLTIGGAGNTTIAGAITTGTGTLTKNDAGTLTLSGANTFTGNTTISAGTLALGAGGSISSSPTITLANGATFDVTAGGSVAASQTLSRNASSGSGTVNGTLSLTSGAKISLQVDGTGGTVGTLSVSGGLTLNNNTISIAVNGAALGAGTYSLISYSGSKSGSFNGTPTITGSGLQSGLIGKIVESAGQISLKVSSRGHGVSAANLKVVENNLANTTESVAVTTTTSINGLQMRDGSSRGDYVVQVGTSATDDLNGGVLLTSISENGRDNGEDSGTNFCTSSISFTSSGYFIPTENAPDGKEYNINVAAGYFPYSRWLGGYARNSGGTNGGANDVLTGSAGIDLGTEFIDNGDGTSTIDLSSLGVNSQSDGVLLVNAGANNNHYAMSKANSDGTWTVYSKLNSTNGAVYSQAPIAFAFIPKTETSLISGKINGDGSILMYSGDSPAFSVSTNLGLGIWQLTIPGYSPSSGVLIISPEGGNGANADNIMSYQASGSTWLIQSRDLPGLGLQSLNVPLASFVFIPAPTIALVSPANGSSVSSSPTLKVTPTDANGGNLSVTFFGHNAGKPGPGKDFLIPVLPDTQNYAREASGSGNATKEMWFAQTDWIIAHRFTDNIPFVGTLGDCVNNADTLSQWKNATNAYYRLEDQSGTQLLEGIPYLVTVGNHDQAPNGDEDGETTKYNQYFGSSHFSNKSYYGGHYSTNNDSWYATFDAGNLQFLVISFEFGRYGSGILDWARATMAANPTRRTIVLTHYAGQDVADVNATTCPFGAQGQAIYTALKTNANFFLMCSGHVFDQGGEGRRTDSYGGHSVHTLVSDYQGRFNGGNGLMRLMYFSPSNNTVSVKTYSPYTGNYEVDANSQFSFTYNMQPNGAGTLPTAYAAVGTNLNVTSGTQTSVTWSGLSASQNYAWYVVVTNEAGDYATSTEWTFSTTSGFSRPVGDDADRDGISDAWETQNKVTDANADNDGDGQSNLSEYIAKTDPNDAGSTLKIVDATRDADGHVTLKWASVGGVRYRVQYSDDAVNFIDIERDAASETDSNAAGETSTQTFTDSATNTLRFYRVKIVP